MLYTYRFRFTMPNGTQAENTLKAESRSGAWKQFVCTLRGNAAPVSVVCDRADAGETARLGI